MSIRRLRCCRVRWATRRRRGWRLRMRSRKRSSVPIISSALGSGFMNHILFFSLLFSCLSVLGSVQSNTFSLSSSVLGSGFISLLFNPFLRMLTWFGFVNSTQSHLNSYGGVCRCFLLCLLCHPATVRSTWSDSDPHRYERK